MRHRVVPLFLIVIAVLDALLGSGGPALAEEAEKPYTPPAFITESPALPAGWEGRGVWRLGLRDALRRSVENNLGIVLQREALVAADARIAVAAGTFEPTLSARYFHSDIESRPATSIEGGAGDILTLVDDGWALSLAERLPTGTQLRLDFTSGRSRSDLGTAVQPLNYRSIVAVELVQPLLRGFSLDLEVPRVELLRARLSSRRERDELAIQMMDVVQRTESAYWDVVQALKRYRVQLDSLERARAQLDLTRRQIQAGVLAPSDLISAESTLAQRRLALVQAEADIEQAWDALRQVLNLPRPEWRRAIVPADAPVFEPHSISDEEALRAAMANRPEIRQQRLAIESAAADVRAAENDRLPQIDVGLSYQSVGQDDVYRGALDQLAGLEAPGWTVTATLSWTPLARAAGAQVDIQRANQRAARARRNQRVLDLYREVRDAVRALDTAARQVRAAARFRELAERSLDTEQRKFVTGTSSNFFVAQRQEEVAQAQLEELGALLGHQKAQVAVERQTGRLLERRGIVFSTRGF